MIFNHKVWLSWNQQSCMQLLYVPLQAAMQDLPRHFGFSWPLTILFYHGDQVYWLNRWEELRALGFKILDALLVPGYARYFFDREFPDRSSAIEVRVAEISSLDLSIMDREDLIREYKRFLSDYREWYALGWYAEPAQFCAEALMEEELRYLRDTEKVDERTLAECKVHLYSSPHTTYSAEIEDHLLSTAKALFSAAQADGLELQYNRDSGKLLVLSAGDERATSELSPGDFFEQYVQVRPAFEDSRHLIAEHIARYFWKKNNYYATHKINEFEITAECLIIAREGHATDFDSLIGASARRIAEKQSLRQQIYRELRPYYRSIVDVLSQLSYLKDVRKKVICQANHGIDLFLAEVACRVKCKPAELRQLIPAEVEEVLRGDMNGMHEEVTRRNQVAVVFWGEHDTVPAAFTGNPAFHEVNGMTTHSAPAAWAMDDSVIASGETADEFIRVLNDKYFFLLDWGHGQNIAAITGECVYYRPGEDEIEGIVRIVTDPTKFDNFNDGEILVAPSTTPDYVPLMRRACCIITDWGGWTSHAALVAREMNKPCIIGTYHASQVLSSGQTVRVRVREGLVFPVTTCRSS